MYVIIVLSRYAALEYHGRQTEVWPRRESAALTLVMVFLRITSNFHKVLLKVGQSQVRIHKIAL
jgi:hypothetical protein